MTKNGGLNRMSFNVSSIKTGMGNVRTAAFALALVVSAGLGVELHGKALAQQTQTQLPSPQDLSRTFISLAKQVKPAVVNIDVVEKTKRSAMRLPDGFPQIPGFGDTPRRQ